MLPPRPRRQRLQDEAWREESWRIRPLHNSVLAAGWFVFFLTGLAAMIEWPEMSTIPFHLIWLSFTVVYGICAWRRTSTLLLSAILFIATLAILLHHHNSGRIEAEELVEVPLMLAIFLTVYWQVSRHRRLTAETQKLADEERQLRMRQLELAQRSSHELRTPLTVARGHLDFVRLGLTDDPDLRADVSTAISELDRIALISKGLLALARVEGLGLATEVIEPVPFLEAVLQRWSPCAGRQWRMKCDAVPFRGDVERLTAALDALIDNACRHTAAGSTVELHAALVGNDISLSVRDHGPGIPADALPHVFDPFWQAVRRRDRRYSGTGLGLTIVQSVAQAHGGHAVASNAAGGGALFTLVLPGCAGNREAVRRADLVVDAPVAGPATPPADRR